MDNIDKIVSVQEAKDLWKIGYREKYSEYVYYQELQAFSEWKLLKRIHVDSIIPSHVYFAAPYKEVAILWKLKYSA